MKGEEGVPVFFSCTFTQLITMGVCIQQFDNSKCLANLDFSIVINFPYNLPRLILAVYVKGRGFYNLYRMVIG